MQLSFRDFYECKAFYKLMKYTYEGGGHWGSVHFATPQKKTNKQRITAKKVARHRHRNFIFCSTINLIQISVLRIEDRGVCK